MLRTTDLGEGAILDFDPDFLSLTQADRALTQLLKELPLRPDTFKMGARVIPVPRLLSWHADPGCSYRYSRKSYPPRPWTPGLAKLRERLLATTGYRFNGVLANHYRDGADSMGMHADDEPELGPSRDDIAVASVSLGDARRFVLKHKVSGQRRVFELGHGSLLVMRGTTQLRYRHGLPKTKRPVGARLNLTFRVVRPREPPSRLAVE